MQAAAGGQQHNNAEPYPAVGPSAGHTEPRPSVCPAEDIEDINASTSKKHPSTTFIPLFSPPNMPCSSLQHEMMARKRYIHTHAVA
jgi:hypothetical protein